MNDQPKPRNVTGLRVTRGWGTQERIAALAARGKAVMTSAGAALAVRALIKPPTLAYVSLLNDYAGSAFRMLRPGENASPAAEVELDDPDEDEVL